jgi:predicted GNAT family acetyltransferase
LLTLFFIQGDVIHAIIWKSLIDTFKTVLNENCMYTVKNFKVQQSTIYHHVEMELKIIFVYNTNVKEVTEISSVLL